MSALQLVFLPLTSCGDLPRNYDLLVALELARTTNDLSLVFGHSATACAQALAAKLELINAFDTLLFVPVYAYFLWSCVQALAGADRVSVARLKRLVVVSAVADLTENLILQLVIARPFSSTRWLSLLPWATDTKWLALGVFNLGLALLYRASSVRRLTSSAVVAVGTTSCAVAILTQVAPRTFGPWLAAGVSAGWLTWLVLNSVHYWNERSLA